MAKDINRDVGTETSKKLTRNTAPYTPKFDANMVKRQRITQSQAL